MHLHLVTLHTQPSPQAIPLAAACLKAYLDARPTAGPRPRVTLADAYLATPLEEITSAILAARPDVVGFSLYSWNRDACEPHPTWSSLAAGRKRRPTPPAY